MNFGFKMSTIVKVLKKYRNTVQQLSNEQLTLHEQANRIAELESERSSLKEQLAEVTSRLENIETHGDPTSSLTVKRLELKTKELESKLDLELTTRSRMEASIFINCGIEGRVDLNPPPQKKII